MKIIIIMISVFLISACDQADNEAQETSVETQDVSDVTAVKVNGEAEKASSNDKSVADELQMKRANIAVNMFKDVCYLNYDKQEERIAMLDEQFTRHKAESKDLFLGLFKVESGDAWAAVMSRGVYVVVVDDNENCHIAALHADADQIHDNIEVLYKNAKNVKEHPDVEYLEKAKIDFFEVSGFDVIHPKGGKLVRATASTNANPPEGKPEALLSLIVEQ